MYNTNTNPNIIPNHNPNPEGLILTLRTTTNLKPDKMTIP